jgi:isocitrate dehydrogenase
MEALSDITKGGVSAFTVGGGGGGSANVGAAILDFGAAPGTNIASVSVTGQTTITSTATIQAWTCGLDSTADHNLYEHMLLPLWLTINASAITVGTGFTLTGFTELRLVGLVKVRWSWS